MRLDFCILAEVAAWTKELNTEVAITINNALPAVRENAPLMLGTDPIGIGYYTDGSLDEDAYGPQLHENGLLTHRVRQFKLCRAVGTIGVTYMSEQEERMLRQDLSHAAAFNEGNVGCIGFPPHMDFANRYTVHFETKCNFMRWLNEHREYFKGVAARLALRSGGREKTWRCRGDWPTPPRCGWSNWLVETCRGFDFVLEESPKALRRYDLVVVPNVECMSWKQIEGLVAYAAEGGGLLIGQDAAVYDLWHRRRIENPWAALFGTASAKSVVADAVAQGVAGVLVAASTQNQSDAVTLVGTARGGRHIAR